MVLAQSTVAEMSHFAAGRVTIELAVLPRGQFNLSITPKCQHQKNGAPPSDRDINEHSILGDYG